MISIRKLAFLALILWASSGAAPAGSDADPAGYRLRVPVMTTGESGVQRLRIPAEALAASQTRDVSDVRVFDGANRAVPIARIATAEVAGRRYELAVLPVLGASDTLDVTNVSLRIDGQGRARVARIEGTAAAGPARPMLLGALLDARTITGNAESLTIDARIPEGQPVTFAIEASRDLQNWRPIAEKVAYRRSAPGADAIAVTVPLGETALAADYLRVTWRATSRLLSPVTVLKAAVTMRSGQSARMSIAAVPPPLAEPHTIAFLVPFATPLESITVTPTGNDVIVPIRILGRENLEQPWALLGEGTAVRANGSAGSTREIALDPGTYRAVRIEADRRSAGFTSPPRLRLHFAPRDIAFLANDRRPFTLAVGRTGASDPYLPLDSLMTQADAGLLPTATTRATIAALRLEPIDTARASRRQALLWAILLASTALLGAMAWTLWRRNQPERAPTAADPS